VLLPLPLLELLAHGVDLGNEPGSHTVLERHESPRSCLDRLPCRLASSHLLDFTCGRCLSIARQRVEFLEFELQGRGGLALARLDLGASGVE
jgi:hypothetical protein